MVTPADSTPLQKLEANAHDCERNGDFLGALDAYEEIERHGWANARHRAALGYCYIKNRQRQFARTVWLRALEQEPGSKLCREALDKHFPGWEAKNAPAPAGAPRPAAPAWDAPPPPPPPPPASFINQDLTVETTTSSAIAPARTPAALPIPEEDPFYKAPPAARAPRPAPPLRRAQDTTDSRVNWDFVMQDASAEAAARLLH